MTARQTHSASCDVGYCKPPRHAQFRKGQSGNPGGRPRREPVERLKALTLQEAYRGMTIRREDGIAEPALAIQAILRSQVELAMGGNVRAQRDILNAVRAYERADAEKAAAEAYVEELVRRAMDLEDGLRAAEDAARTPEKKMNYIEAADRIRQLLAEAAARRDAANSAPGQETATTESDAERTAAAPAPSAGGAPQPENGSASAAPPVTSPLPAAARPAAPPSGPRPSRSRSDRYARHRARESTPPAGAGVRAGRLHNRLLRDRLLRNRCHHRRTGHPAQLFAAPWKQVTSRRSRRQKSASSLLNSLFSGNAGIGRPQSAPAATGTWR
jgi:hypothetical protein